MSRGYPSPTDYNSAVKQLNHHILDPLLQTGTPRFFNGGPLVYSGGFASVFVVDAGGSCYALRCWTRDIGDAADHYHAINGYLEKRQLPYFTQFHFSPEGILVNGSKYPTLRMDWLDGEPLKEFIDAHRHNARVLIRTAEAFLEMCVELHLHRIAHGDLQSDNLNVRVHNADVELRLLDYDTLHVPTRSPVAASSFGLPAYQHPRRGESKISTEKDDHYSELVIYLSLMALAEDGRLWDDFQVEAREKDFLFSAADLTANQPSALFQRLRTLSPLVSNLTLMLWNFTRHPDILTLPPLEESIRLAQAKLIPCVPAELAGFDLFLAQNIGKPAGNGKSSSDAWFDEWPAILTPPARSASQTESGATTLFPKLTPAPTMPAPAMANTTFDSFLKNSVPSRGTPPAQASAPAQASVLTTASTPPQTAPISPLSTPVPKPSKTSENIEMLLGCLAWAFFIIMILWGLSHCSR